MIFFCTSSYKTVSMRIPIASILEKCTYLSLDPLKDSGFLHQTALYVGIFSTRLEEIVSIKEVSCAAGFACKVGPARNLGRIGPLSAKTVPQSRFPLLTPTGWNHMNDEELLLLDNANTISE